MAQLFIIMEAASKKFDIDDYGITQTTLEHVFMNFARDKSAQDGLENMMVIYIYI